MENSVTISVERYHELYDAFEKLNEIKEKRKFSISWNPDNFHNRLLLNGVTCAVFDDESEAVIQNAINKAEDMFNDQIKAHVKESQ